MTDEAPFYIKQNDPGMNDSIRRIGCFWRVGMKLAEELAGEAFKRTDELNALWAESLFKGLMVDDGSGPELHKGVVPIINLGLEYFGCERKLAEIGVFNTGRTNYYGWYKAEPPEETGERFFVQKIELGPGHVEKFHYREVFADGKVKFDPYRPAIKAHDICYSIILEEIL